MLKKAIPKPDHDVTPTEWRETSPLLLKSRSARLKLPGFVGSAQKPVDERWFSVSGENYARLQNQSVLDVVSLLTDTSAWAKATTDALDAITASDFIGTMVYAWITGQARNAQGELLFLDADGLLTTEDTGTAAGAIDEQGNRGEFLGVPIT